MADDLTISLTPPDLESMQYDFLREQGLVHIERLSNKIWTDYNISDPGITILEVLSYAITDLGYRSTYSIPDILAQNPDAPQVELKNFYTAREILPICPVTFNDYRKLLIDVEIDDPSDLLCPQAGVKNAWLQISDTNEVPIYVDYNNDKLSYLPQNPNQSPLDIKPLYNVILEFDECENLGDLNANTIEYRFQLYNTCGISSDFDTNLSGVGVEIILEFASWDTPGIDWLSYDDIKENITNIRLEFENLPSGYEIQGYGLDNDKKVWVSITNNNTPIASGCIQEQLNFILTDETNSDSLVHLYQRKILKVLDIVDEVRKKLMANRNLCEDFYKISALKVEEIAMCGDIVVATDADIEQVEAEIYFQIRNFLSPTVYFYTLEQMYEKGYKTEEIYEGPRLDHGFIDTNELENANVREVIHVSDLYQIIMDIPGVEAVRGLQIANIPLDNTTNIPSQSVKWCLKLAFDQNYVPRLTTERSNLTFIKDELPFKANEGEVDTILDELISNERPQKLYDIPLDIPVPEGSYRAISDYESIQEEFPLTYGIGSEGLPPKSSDERKAQAKQLKGFLLFFDQLLADYLSQLSNVGELFSMNGEKNSSGSFIIDKSYFSQSLEPYVPNIDDLLVNISDYPENLQEITETEVEFEGRRNRFLNHLMARFGEQFTDYAMVVYKMTGKKAPNELLVDKLNFLNRYPEISGGRFKAMNYESPCKIWSIDNVSGLEKRVSLLSGVEEPNGSKLHFSSDFKITETAGTYNYTLAINVTYKLYSYDTFDTEKEAKIGLENLIINGISVYKYEVSELKANQFYITVVCDEGNILAKSDVYPSEIDAENDLQNFIAAAQPIFINQYFNNPESNRKNLECPLYNYFVVQGYSTVMENDPPTFEIEYNLNYYYPDDPNENFSILNGPFVGYGPCKKTKAIESVDPGSYSITVDGDLSNEIDSGDEIEIVNSNNNNGFYIISSLSVNEPIPGTFTTEVVFSSTPTLIDSSPYGIMKYSTISSTELEEIAEENEENSLFEIAQRGLLKNNYTFSSYNPLDPYVFHLLDQCGTIIGTSVESNFNNDLSIAIDSIGSIEVINSTTNDNTYTIVSAISKGAIIEVEVDSSIPSPIGDGMIQFTEDNISIASISTEHQQIVIEGQNLSRKLFNGEEFTIYDSINNNESFIVEHILYNPTTDKTIITVSSGLNSEPEDSGKIRFTKDLKIKSVNTTDNIFTVIGGADEFAVQQMIDFFKSKFFSHEGMHLIEHILLRPKFNEDVFLGFDQGAQELVENLDPKGALTFMKKLPITLIDQPNKTFIIPGNRESEFAPIQKIYISGSTDGLNDGEYDLIQVNNSGSETLLKVLQNIPEESPSSLGDVVYEQQTSVASVTNTSVTIAFDISEFDDQYPVTISGSEDGINDDEYIIDTISGNSSSTTINLLARKTLIQDELLNINIDANCESCEFDNPYSFILTAVLPAWQGRFVNNDFRTFFEKTFRQECPSHLVANICWLSPTDMKFFEEAYKRWLNENQKPTKDVVKLHLAHQEFVDVLKNIRSSYSEGTLHDCEEDDTLTNAIILNKTIIGTN